MTKTTSMTHRLANWKIKYMLLLNDDYYDGDEDDNKKIHVNIMLFILFRNKNWLVSNKHSNNYMIVVITVHYSLGIISYFCI